ncbi:hypothetical protein [Streptomyces cyaneofuscatus]|uniref:hypothetical protein n=1 Tax=Streptomyces cyaneofuscatus TaxID=66883 RepID=UPI0036AE7614
MTGLRLCAGCRETLVAAIRQLPVLYHGCEQVLGGNGPGSLREKTSGGNLPSAPFNLAAADVRAAILGLLGSWSGLVAGERHCDAPRRDVHLLAHFLLRNADWLAAHPAASEALAETTALARRARRVTGADEQRRVHVGHCVMDGCTGTLSTPVGTAQAARTGEIRCDADSTHTWASHQWTHLRRALHGSPSTTERASARRWLTAADISRLWSIPKGSVYRKASENKWERRHRSGRTFYAESDVHASLGSR